MLKLRPPRLRERIGLIVLLHLLAMIAVILLFLEQTDMRKMAPLYRVPIPEKVALVVTAFERTPPKSHPDLVRAFSDATMRVAMLSMLPAERRSSATPSTLYRYQQALGGRPFRIETSGDIGPADLNMRPAVTMNPVRISVALSGGNAIMIEQMVAAPLTKIANNLMLFLAAVAVLDIAVILWLAAQTTRPVERLARAVREDRLDTLRSHGPREIVELGEAFRQLRQHLRALLDERTRMLAAIAHDYRTYLTRMDLRSEFIEDEQQRALAGKDIEEMRDLLSDTLTFARESAATDLDVATCDIRAELALVAEERLQRNEHVDVAPLPHPVHAHVSHISFQRMMANLLDNAVRYGGGRAYIHVETASPLVRIMIEDDGPGVPDARLARLTEPFERLEPSRARGTGGVGLGLSIVEALTQRYGGNVMLENRPEGGFRAILLLRNAEAAERT
jgi:two-component system osmolarity sensor histidine kinase EnvZ